MRSIFISACLFISSFTFAQNNITGKWKPVSFSMDKIMTANVKTDSIFLSDTLDVILKDDKDPAASKELLQFMAGMLLEKMKNTEQEFLASGDYIETDKRRNTNKNGTYTYDVSNNLLTTKIGNKSERFVVSFNNGHLFLSGELENRKGKKGELLIELERL